VGTELEETAAERARMRHPQVWPELHEQLHEARIVSEDTDGPTFDLGEDALVEVRDEVSRVANS